MNAVLLWSVPPGVRPLAMSLSVVATHLLGDVPSPPLLGLLQGWLRNWRCAAACAGTGHFSQALHFSQTLEKIESGCHVVSCRHLGRALMPPEQ